MYFGPPRLLALFTGRKDYYNFYLVAMATDSSNFRLYLKTMLNFSNDKIIIYIYFLVL